jgi:hypothetical protein
MKPKKRKGSILDEEIIKMVIAVACIAGLIYLGYMLYNMSTQKTRMEQARLNLNEISGVMSSMKNEERINFTLLSPNGYLLTGWPYEVEGISIMPDTCINNKWKSCICLCRFNEKTKFLGDSILNLGGTIGGIIELKTALSKSGLPRAVAASCVTEGVCRETPGGHKADTTSIKYITDQTFMQNAGDVIKIAAKAGGGSIREFEKFFAIRVEDLLNNGASVGIRLGGGTYYLEPVK